MAIEMRISSAQIFWMVFTFEVPNALLFTVSAAITNAKQDAWISMLVAGVAGLLVTYLVIRLGLLFPSQTLIQMSQTILGKWLGKLIVLPFFLQWYTITGVIVRNLGTFLLSALFHRTPFWPIAITIVLLLVYSIYQGGIEGLARISQILGPIILLTVCVLLALDAVNMNWHRLLPIYQDTGWHTILQGAVDPTTFYSEVTMLTMLLPFVIKPHEALPRALWGVGIAALIVTMATIAVIFTFGPELSTKMWNPFYNMIRYISVVEFIQNVDVLVVIVWFSGSFVKLSTYLFIACFGTAQWLQLKNWRNVVWVLAPLVLLVSMMIKNDQTFTRDIYINVYWVRYVLPINLVGIPALLLVVALLKERVNARRKGKGGRPKRALQNSNP